MTKADLSQIIAEKAGISKKQAAEITAIFFDTIIENVKDGNDIIIPGFGTFTTKEIAARTGEFRGVKYETKAHKAPAFKPGKTFKDALI